MKTLNSTVFNVFFAMHQCFRSWFASILIVQLLAPWPSLALTFNRHNILSDQELVNTQSFSVSSILKFLKRKQGLLGAYQTPDLDGIMKPAGQIIYNAARQFELNPKVFIVMFQKESGVVTNNLAEPSILEEYPLGFGICDSCDKNDPAIVAKYKGFTKQVYAAGDRIRNGYLADLETKGSTISGWGPGITKTTLDGLTVKPKNNATAALYTYNPWVGAYGGGDPRWGANSLFWKLWNEWFQTTYPDGSLLRDVDGNGTIYLIEQSVRRPFKSRAAFFSSFSEDRVINVPRNVVDAYEEGTPIKYPGNALLRGPDGKTYVVVDGAKRLIKGKKTFQKIGFNPEERIDVKEEELAALPDGEPITPESIFPTGALLQYKETGTYVYIGTDGRRHQIRDEAILKSHFPDPSVALVQDSEDITSFPVGEPLRFRDGDLVSSRELKTVYLISNGLRRPFKSREVFEALGYQWKNILWTTPPLIEKHEQGKTLHE